MGNVEFGQLKLVETSVPIAIGIGSPGWRPTGLKRQAFQTVERRLRNEIDVSLHGRSHASPIEKLAFSITNFN